MRFRMLDVIGDVRVIIGRCGDDEWYNVKGALEVDGRTRVFI